MNHTELTQAELYIYADRKEFERKIAECKQAIEEHEDDLVCLRQKCEHRIRKHHPRATAECDSWDECEVCGAVL